jgi:hypothetical protein
VDLGCLVRLSIVFIYLKEGGGSNQMTSYLGILIASEGRADEKTIDAELKYIFKGKADWSVKKIGEAEFMLYFPSEGLRNELTKFKGFEFAAAPVKAKVEAMDLDK